MVREGLSHDVGTEWRPEGRKGGSWTTTGRRVGLAELRAERGRICCDHSNSPPVNSHPDFWSLDYVRLCGKGELRLQTGLRLRIS